MTNELRELLEAYHCHDVVTQDLLDRIDVIWTREFERLNRMLRETGYGQGSIDAYVAQCEEIEQLRKALDESNTRFHEMNTPTGREIELKQEVQRLLEELHEAKRLLWCKG